MHSVQYCVDVARPSPIPAGAPMANWTTTRVVGVLTALVVAAMLAGCASKPKSAARAGRVVDIIKATDREQIRPFRGQLLDGSAFNSKTLAGSVIVYNVWGSWCAPCRTEAPALKRVSEEGTDLGVRFVGINVRDDDASARAFENRFEIGYPSITTSTSSAALLAFARSMPPSAVPSTLVVDRRGRLAARIIGPTDYTTLSSLVSDIAAESRPSK